MTINDYLRAEHARYIAANPNTVYPHAKRVTCADGFYMSVQASEAHYCAPRENIGPWSKVEVGYPSQVVDELTPYAEEPNRPTDTVYGWVPVSLIDHIIAEHGGIR